MSGLTSFAFGINVIAIASALVSVASVLIAVQLQRRKTSSTLHIQVNGEKLNFDAVDSENIDATLHVVREKILAAQKAKHHHAG